MAERELYPDGEQRRRIMDFIMAAGQTLLENGAEVFRVGKNAVGQHIDMELPQVEAGRHDLHGLLHPEHLCPVSKRV